MTDTITTTRRSDSARAFDRLQLSRRTAFWTVAGAFAVVTAFSTAPSSLYGLYERHEHLSSLAVTLAYAVYAVGVVMSLMLAGHVSDWYGRRTVLMPSIAVAALAAIVFVTWRSLAGLLAARVLTGVAVGAAVATATAFITDLDAGPSGAPTRRSAIVATIANIGGLAIGPLVAGLLAGYAGHPLTLPFEVFFVALALAMLAVVLAPDVRRLPVPRPPYHPQRLAAPAGARRQFIAAIAGGFLCFAVFGLFAGLAGRFLAGPLHDPSPALSGLAILLTFGSGVIVQTTTIDWPPRRLIATGVLPALIGLGVLVASAWTSPASLALFIAGGVIAGSGGGAIFRGSLALIISTSGSGDRAGALATFFVAGYAGLSVPVLGLGLLLETLSPRVTLLIFGLAVGLGILAAAPVLIGQPTANRT